MNASPLTKNIYTYNNEKLNDKDYFLLELQGKRELIDEVLKEYLIEVIKTIKSVGKDLDDLDTLGLMEYLKGCLDEEEADKALSSVVFYITGLIQGIQKFAIDWRISKDESMIETPFLTIRGNKLYSIETHKETDLVKTFELVYSFLQNKLDEIDYENQGNMDDIRKYTLEGGLQ
ncbi:MAG: hypothetical protein K2L98_01750 [Bacilli bacterium]|nr:hypothetical protein [Bacilli bacterium]